MSKIEHAILGGGCFWCVEAVFNLTKGVQSAISGYTGGPRPNPTYEQVCSGTSGHVEVVKVTFDPDVIPYRDIVRLFFTVHDPTTLNRQGNDFGTQYRSVIFCDSPEQERISRDVIAELGQEHIFDAPVVTSVEPATEFYPAEGYHQNYFATNPHQPYCAYIVAPKVMKFRKQFAARLKD